MSIENFSNIFQRKGSVQIVWKKSVYITISWWSFLVKKKLKKCQKISRIKNKQKKKREKSK